MRSDQVELDNWQYISEFHLTFQMVREQSVDNQGISLIEHLEYLDSDHWSDCWQKISLIATWSILSTFSFYLCGFWSDCDDVSLELDKYDLIGDNAIIESPINLMIMKRTPRQFLQRVNKVNHLRSWKSADGPTQSISLQSLSSGPYF